MLRDHFLGITPMNDGDNTSLRARYVLAADDCSPNYLEVALATLPGEPVVISGLGMRFMTVEMTRQAAAAFKEASPFASIRPYKGIALL